MAGLALSGLGTAGDGTGRDETRRSGPGAATGTGCRERRLPQPELLAAADTSARSFIPLARVCTLPPRPRQPCAGSEK